MSASPHPSVPNWLSVPTWLGGLISAARATDGQPPFSDQSLVDLRAGTRRLLAISEVAAAIVSPTEAELVVIPDARGRGHGSALVSTIVSSSQPGFLVWAHGDHPAARALAARYGFEPVRRLLQLRLTLPEFIEPADISIGPIRLPADIPEWLALNAQAFAHHPEQGSVTRDDLDGIMAEPWFDASAFLVMRDGEGDGDRMLGYCWLKVEHDVGELYVVGVDPAYQGRGIGRQLVEAGLAELAHRGIRESSLYVEADNEPALKLYTSLGYTEYSVDIQYALTRFTPRSHG